MIRISGATAICFQLLYSQATPPVRANDPWQALHFLEGTWGAKTRNAGSGVEASGSYTFRKELGGHILARHTKTTGCNGPLDYNCEHSDLLYVYQEQPGQPLKAIYFDNEGHVIHYTVSTEPPARAVFLSARGAAVPQFRLIYELRGNTMEGKFQVLAPGKSEWASYLEWSGTKQ